MHNTTTIRLLVHIRALPLTRVQPVQIYVPISEMHPVCLDMRTYLTSIHGQMYSYTHVGVAHMERMLVTCSNRKALSGIGSSSCQFIFCKVLCSL